METFLIPTAKRKQKLVHQHYLYTKRRVSKNSRKIYWRCEKRNICNSTIVTNADLHGGIEVLKNARRHTHEPDVTESARQRIMSNVREDARERPNVPPVAVLQDHLVNVDSEVLAALPERQAMLRNVNRYQNAGRPPIPQSLASLVILPPYNETLSGEPFLRFDSGQDDPDRILIFTTNAGLKDLARSRILVSDGTFKTVPDVFYQLYTLHGEVMGKLYPLVYCLTMRKTEETYRRIFAEVKSLTLQLNPPLQLLPQFIMTDMEAAVIQAARAEFPGSVHKICLFHFSQAIWRQVIGNGLKADYHNPNNRTIRNDVQCLMSLPFVPETDILQVFDLLIDHVDPRVLPIAEYVEATYVRGRRARGRRRATPPLFPSNLWCAHESVLNDLQRTTNEAEGWHSRFQRMLVSHHASMWKFLEAVRKDQQDTSNQITQILAGHRRVKHAIPRSYVINHNQVKSIVSRYREYKDRDDILLYLRSIGYHLKRHAAAGDDNSSDDASS